MKPANDHTVLFAGSSHQELARQVAKEAGIRLGKISISTFPDGEISVQILESVRGAEVFVFQTLALEPNDHLMELLIIIDALKRAAARNIVAVIPYFGYSRQDRRDGPRKPITAKLVADLLTTAGATQVLTMDLHAGQIEGFFNIPVDNLFGRQVLVEEIRKLSLKNSIVVAPDIGSVKIARSYGSLLGVDFAVVDKHRSSATQVEALTLIGDVNGKDVLLADDMCTTAGTLVSAAKACQEKGARRIIASVTHGVFSSDALDKIEKSPIEALLVTDTIPTKGRTTGSSKVHVCSSSHLFAQAIHCILTGESIVSLDGQ